MNSRGDHRHRHGSSREQHPHHIPLPRALDVAANYLPHNRPARIAIVAGVVIICAALVVGLVFRGSIPAGMAGPWITQVLEEKLGPGHRVEIGETWFETDAMGASLLRVRDLVIRGPENAVVASAPSAEVQLEGGLFSGSYRARRIDLVNAEMTVQVDAGGQVAVFAGRDSRPTKPLSRPAAVVPPASDAVPAPAEPFRFAELVTWLDGLERKGLDGIALTEVGLKRGTLIVDSARSGRRWTFRNIDSRLERKAGGISFSISSGDPVGRWSITATVGAAPDGARAVDLVVDRLSPRDILLALGLDGIDFHAETPLSGILRAQIAADGRLIAAVMRLSAASGEVGKNTQVEGRFKLDEAQLQVRFDAERRAVIIDPLAFAVGSNQIVIQAMIEAPRDDSPNWPITVTQGRVVLSTGDLAAPPLVIERVSARAVYDPIAQKLIVERGELSGPTAGLAFSGSISTGGKAPALSLGIAGTRMSASAFMRLWPALVAPAQRTWIMNRVDGGVVDRVLVAIGVPLDIIGRPEADLPDAAARVEIAASAAQYRPVVGLPAVRDATLGVTITGRTTRVRMERGVMDTPSGKHVTLRDGTLEVPDMRQPAPKGTIRFKLEGAADAVAEIVAMEPLRDVVGFTFDPATTKGSVTGSVRLDLPFKTDLRKEELDYLVDAEVKNFSADRTVRNQRVEAVNAKLSLTPKSVVINGEGQIAGAPATFEYRRSKLSADAEFRIASTLGDTARARIGIDFTPWLSGPVGVRAQGRVTDRETRIDVEADLTAAKIADLVPGWQKPVGRPSKATYRVIEREHGIKIDNLNVTGSGTTLRGSIEFDGDGALVAANLPVFHLADGDKANLRTERSADGVLRVFVRGERLDARSMVRSITEGPPAPKSARESRQRDLDIDLKLGAATGYNGEIARQLELRISRRGERVRSFALLGRIGTNASVVGELRSRDDGRPVIYIRADDAGAFFRFADLYTRVQRGEVWVVIEPPGPTEAPQEGIVAVRDFVIRGERGLDRLQSAAPPERLEPGTQRRVPQQPGDSMVFSRLRLHFTRTPGRFVIREGVIFGPALGATVDGTLDYAANQIQVRGTYIPAYGLNNLFGRIPVLGYILGGGPNEGLLAVTFEIVGPTSGPMLRVNPMSAVAPGFLRKIFEYRASPDIPIPEGVPR
jgi:hypothetical protein